MTFSEILEGVVQRIPGAQGAIFVDWDGEPVSQFTAVMSDLDFQIFGAQWGLVWTSAHKALARATAGRVEELVVDWGDGLVVMRQVTDQYYVVLLLGRGHLATALRELAKGAATLRAEM